MKTSLFFFTKVEKAPLVWGEGRLVDNFFFFFLIRQGSPRLGFFFFFLSQKGSPRLGRRKAVDIFSKSQGGPPPLQYYGLFFCPSPESSPPKGIGPLIFFSKSKRRAGASRWIL